MVVLAVSQQISSQHRRRVDMRAGNSSRGHLDSDIKLTERLDLVAFFCWWVKQCPSNWYVGNVFRHNYALKLDSIKSDIGIIDPMTKRNETQSIGNDGQTATVGRIHQNSDNEPKRKTVQRHLHALDRDSSHGDVKLPWRDPTSYQAGAFATVIKKKSYTVLIQAYTLSLRRKQLCLVLESLCKSPRQLEHDCNRYDSETHGC